MTIRNLHHRTLRRRLCAFALVCGALAAAGPAATQATAAATQTSVANSVTVKVTPRAMGAAAETWVFAVVLDTHSQELADDLTGTVVLVTDDGREVRPASWNGPGAGGHHREGTLEFAAPKPHPKAVALRMQRAGETQPRYFRWSL